MTDDHDEPELSMDELDAQEAERLTGRAKGLEDYAVYALTQGWDPIAVWGVNAEGICACKNGKQCKSPGKHPVDNGWQKNPPMTSADAYAEFATATGPRNIGLRTGELSGFWTLDIDPKSSGDQSLLSLEAQYGALPATRIHRTGSGGLHYLWALPDFEVTNARGRLPRGIDVRGNGGFIVAPGSVTSVGAYRTETAGDIAPAPDWLLELIRPQTLDRQIEVVESILFDKLDPAAQEKARRYLASAVDGEVRRLEAMKQGAANDMSAYRGEPWNHTVYEVCCNLLELAQSQWLPFGMDEIKAILRDHAPTDRGFTGADVMGRLASAANKVRGKDRPMPSSITQDTWDLLTAGLEKHLPKASDGSTVTQWPEESWNQVGNAKRTLRMAAGRLAWVPERGTWLEAGPDGVWREPLARVDDIAAKWCARAMEAAQTLEAHNYDDEKKPVKPTPTNPDGEGTSKRDKFMKFMDESSKVEMHTAVSTQLRRRAGDFGVEVAGDQFDTAPHEFACANGVLNLRTGEVRTARLDDYISVASKVAYDPEMPIPHFQRFLETSQPDPEVRDFLQKVLGYSMTNETSEQRMFMHFGAKTANGKSVLMKVLKAIMGDHFAPASEKTIIRQKAQSTQRIGQDMVDLRGPRFLMLNETDEGGILDSAAVKSITSGDLRADRPHAKANIQYRITGKIHLVTNHLPHITPDPAMRRRLTVIPWKQTFVDNPDPNLEAKLMGELPGILAWLVQGAIRWYADFAASSKTGLTEPEACARELDAFFDEEDEVGSWVKEATSAIDPAENPTSWTTSKDLYGDYVRWRSQQSAQGQPLSINAFGRRLGSKGYDARTVRLGDGTVKVRPLKLKAAPNAATGFFN